MTARDCFALGIELAFKAALIALAGTIIKDVLLGGLVLAAVAALQLSLSGTARRGWVFLGLACLATIAMIRPTNFVLLLLPAWAFLYFSGASRRTFWLAASAVTLAALLLLPAYGVLTRVAFGPWPVQPEKQLILFDIAAVSASTGQNLFAALAGGRPMRSRNPALAIRPRCGTRWQHGASAKAIRQPTTKAMAAPAERRC
jgi:hypothetical protein